MVSVLIKFIYPEKARKFCKIFPLLLTTVHTVKSKGKIKKNFSEYMNFIKTDTIFFKVLVQNFENLIKSILSFDIRECFLGWELSVIYEV